MPTPPKRAAVLAVVSNKGGVGKTTVAANLAIYLRALREDLPVLVVGLDDQSSLDRMFELAPVAPQDANLKHGWAERSLTRVIRLGEYGIHFVPSPPETAALKNRAADPDTLRRILDQTEWSGVVILDTKSDLEALTRNALHAADRVLLPVTDRASLQEAAKVFDLLERAHLGWQRARILLTLVDARTRVGPEDGARLHEVLQAEIRRCGWPCYRTQLSRSPRVEALISGGGKPLSILHHARGSLLHRQFRELAEEVLRDLQLDARLPRQPAPLRRAAAPLRTPGVGDWKSALLRGLRGR